MTSKPWKLCCGAGVSGERKGKGETEKERWRLARSEQREIVSSGGGVEVYSTAAISDDKPIIILHFDHVVLDIKPAEQRLVCTRYERWRTAEVGVWGKWRISTSVLVYAVLSQSLGRFLKYIEFIYCNWQVFEAEIPLLGLSFEQSFFRHVVY